MSSRSSCATWCARARGCKSKQVMRFKPQILVVEDEPLSQDMLVRRLSSRGLRVATVSDGQACLDWLKSNVPDLILLDVQMPRMGGLEVLNQIRLNFTHDALPVIL